jgi:hypothetical protein
MTVETDDPDGIRLQGFSAESLSGYTSGKQRAEQFNVASLAMLLEFRVENQL